MATSFKELNIWKKGLELVLIIYKVTAKYPSEEKYNLTSQTRSSSNSVIAQIGEAHGRYFFADKVRVFYQARGEGDETRSHLVVAHELGYLKSRDFEYLIVEYEGLGKGISSYINSLHSKKS